jgi:7-cyano-7-deazaguanine synthase
MSDCVAIVSGGMDSVTLLYYLVAVKQRQPAIISFYYGQKHHKEVALAQAHAQHLGCNHTVCDLTPMSDLFKTSALVSEQIAVPTMASVQGDSQPTTYVPNRNMIFLSLAAAYAESHNASAVFYGAQRHDLYGYWDTTPDFLDRLNHVYSLNRKTPIQIEAPFVHHSKADVLRQGLAIGVDYAQTWSCYEGQDLACGLCPTCAERLAAFAEVGLVDPIFYQSH